MAEDVSRGPSQLSTEAERCDLLLALAERGPAITRSDAFAVVVAKLGFKPSFLKQGGKQGRFPPAMRQECCFGREPCPLALGFKALVWHDERMVDQV